MGKYLKNIKSLTLTSLLFLFILLIIIGLDNIFFIMIKDKKQWNISNIFFLLMMTFVFCIYFFLRFKDSKIKENLLLFHSQINHLSKENIEAIIEVNRIVNQSKEYCIVKEPWTEFWESLVRIEQTENSDVLYIQTQDAQFFFNADSIIYDKINEKLKDYLPHLFIAIGLFGTFYGLSTGISSLNFDSDELSKSIPQLLQGVKTSFFSSLFGMYFSIVTSIIQNIHYGDIESQILSIKDSINQIFDDNLLDREINEIKTTLFKTNKSMDELAKNIVNELQKKMGEKFRDIGEGISNSVVPELARIIDQDFLMKFDNIKNELIQVSVENNKFIKNYSDYINQITNQIENIKSDYLQLSANAKSSFESLNSTIDNITNNYIRLQPIIDKSEITFMNVNEISTKILKASESLNRFVEAEGQIINLWKEYEMKFGKLNEEMVKNISEVRESLSNSIDSYKNFLENSLRKLFNDYDSELAKIVNRFYSLLENFDEKIEDANSIFNSLNLNKK
ncbi:MAG: hypothetical protein PHR06_05630 [Candidatus Cloacimonetes bacterium]|nr:hypothetical protein [Candidatus Cloacimonadota bacterium]